MKKVISVCSKKVYFCHSGNLLCRYLRYILRRLPLKACGNDILGQTLIITLLLIFTATNFCQSQIATTKFIILRMDYQTYETKYLYYFTHSYNIVLPDSMERVYHDLYVQIVPASDFGETIIRSRTSGQIVYKATTVWNGTGRHIFPPSAKAMVLSAKSADVTLKFLDFEDFFFRMMMQLEQTQPGERLKDLLHCLCLVAVSMEFLHIFIISQWVLMIQLLLNGLLFFIKLLMRFHQANGLISAQVYQFAL